MFKFWKKDKVIILNSNKEAVVAPVEWHAGVMYVKVRRQYGLPLEMYKLLPDGVVASAYAKLTWEPSSPKTILYYMTGSATPEGDRS